MIKRAPGILTADFTQAKVVFNTATRMPYILNGTASEIWNLCDKPMQVDKIVEHLFQKHDIDAKKAAADVKSFVEELKKRGLLKLR